MLETNRNKIKKFWPDLSKEYKNIFVKEIRRHEDLMINEFVKDDLYSIANIIVDEVIENILYKNYNIDKDCLTILNDKFVIKNNIDSYLDLSFNNFYINSFFDFKINDILSYSFLNNENIINNLFFNENINKNLYGVNLSISNFIKYNDRLKEYLNNVDIKMDNSKFVVSDYNYCIDDLIYNDKNNNTYTEDVYSWYKYWNVLFNENKLIEKRLNEWKNIFCETLNNKIEDQLNDSILNIYDNIVHEYTFNDKFKMLFEIDEYNKKITLLSNEK